CAELASKYTRRYNVNLCRDSVEQALRSRGQYRQHPHDREEFKERQAQLIKLLNEHSKATNSQLSNLYQEIYGVTLHAYQANKALTRGGIFRKSKTHPKELKTRHVRLKKMQMLHPEWTYKQFAQEYEKKYGVRLKETIVARTLNHLVTTIPQLRKRSKG